MWLKYHSEPILNELWDRNQRSNLEFRSVYDKPQGFWITDDSEDCWKSFCKDENFRLDALTHKHEVVLDESEILIIRSVPELDAFSQFYSSDYWWGPDEEPTKWCDRVLDWSAVAKDYDGIIITPYQWSRRMEHRTRWYYTWDCASGCIWRVRAIKEIKLIEIDYSVLEQKEDAA